MTKSSSTLRNISVFEATLPRPSLSKYYLFIWSEDTLSPENAITMVVREGVVIYISLSDISQAISKLDSVSWQEGLLESEFPYGKIGDENRILFYMDRKNHFRKVYNTSLVVRIIEHFRPCFPMLSGFGPSSSD